MALNADDIARLYAAHARGLVAYFARRTFDPQVASELMAETFASAVADRRAFRGADDEAAAGWLYGIARHQLSNWYRRAAVERRMLGKLGLEPPVLSDLEYERVEELAGLDELRARVASLLAELPGGGARRAAPARARRAPVPGGRRGAGDRRAGGPRAGLTRPARLGRGARRREERGMSRRDDAATAGRAARVAGRRPRRRRGSVPRSRVRRRAGRGRARTSCRRSRRSVSGSSPGRVRRAGDAGSRWRSRSP